jgi:hypothetical protein
MRFYNAPVGKKFLFVTRLVLLAHTDMRGRDAQVRVGSRDLWMG